MISKKEITIGTTGFVWLNWTSKIYEYCRPSRYSIFSAFLAKMQISLYRFYGWVFGSFNINDIKYPERIGSSIS